MKQIIDIIKEEIENGNKADVNLAHYKNHTKQNLPIKNWIGELPEINDTLTNGEQDMAVIAHNVYGDTVGVEFDNGQNITSDQIINMMAKKICWIK